MRRLWMLAALCGAGTAWAQPAPLGDPFVVSPSPSTFDHFEPNLARRPDGSVVAVWTERDAGGDDDVFARVVSATGATLGNVISVNQTSAGDHDNPSVAVDAGGNFVVAWESGTSDVFARRFQADGSGSSEFQVDPTAGTGTDQRPSVGMADDGRFVIVWGDSTTVFTQRYSASGVPQGTAAAIGTGAAPTPQVAMRGDGVYVVVYENYSAATGEDVYVRGFQANGNTFFTEGQVNDDLDGNKDLSNPHYFPTIAMDDAGNFQVAWLRSVSGGADVYWRRLTAGSSPIGAPQKVNTALAAPGLLTTLGVSPTGAATIGWTAVDGRTLRARSFTNVAEADGDPYVVATADSAVFAARGVAFAADGTFMAGWGRVVGTAPAEAVARRYAAPRAAADDPDSDERGGGAPSPGLLALLALTALLRRRRCPTGAGRTSSTPSRC